MNVAFELPTGTDTPERAQRALDLRERINFLWRQWAFIAIVTCFAMVIGVVYLLRATPLYTATAQVLLEPRREKSLTAEAILADLRLDDAATVLSQLSIIQSDTLLRRVVLKERLVDAPANQEQGASKVEGPTEEQRIQSAVSRLRAALKVTRNSQSYVLDISVISEDPGKAAQLANAVADAYLLDQLDARFEAAKKASSWLRDRLAELREQLRDSEEAVAKFRAGNGLERSGANVTLNEQQIADLNSKLIAARATMANKKTLADFLAEVTAGKRAIDSLPEAVQSSPQGAALMTLRQKLTEASQREADLMARYGARHPLVANAQANKRDIEQNIAQETKRLVESVKADYVLAKAQVDESEGALRGATGEGGLDSEASIRLRELERTAAVNKTLFEDFLHRSKITDEEGTFETRDARVITPAQPPHDATFPRSNLVLICSLLAGLAFGVGGATAIEMLHAGFTTPRQVEDVLDIPVLASVRRMPKGKLETANGLLQIPLYQVKHPLSPFSEAMRMLRSGIQMSDVDQPPKVIQITSSRPGEGKTMIALSVAISAAQSNLKVVLVDADLRHPSASRFFKLEKAMGLVDVLTGVAPVEDVMRMDKDLRLMVLPAGTKSMNPPDVLSSERMKGLIANLRQQFDFVVLDTPPVGPVVDSTIVSRVVDKSIFVIQWGSTPRELVQNCVRQLSGHKRVSGAVLNFVNSDRARKYGSEYYYGGTYYDKYYSEESRA